MKLIFDSCTPRPDVLSGELTEEMFAARLRDVLEGTADPAYKDPEKFFENTWPTDGLKQLVREVTGRLSGQEPTNSPFIRLETSFGGGKTHNLIALAHIAAGSGKAAGDLIPAADWLPKQPWAVAGVVGSDLDPANGIRHDDIVTRTVWGELAWQLGAAGDGGAAAWERMRAADEALIAPGTQVMEDIVGDRPTLILLDEIARHLRTAKAVATPNGKSDVAEQTVAFLMTLIEFASSRKNVVVVLTLADSSDAFGTETEYLREELAEAQKVAARQERVLTPTAETEISHIVTHRLFSNIDREAAAATASAYQAFYQQIEKQEADLPQRLLHADYQAAMERDYPFHPELLTTLNRKTATIPNFQKTRGALRLLARVVRKLWEDQPSDAWLIAPHGLDLSDEGILNELTSRLQRPAFRSVVEADLVSPNKSNPAHAEAADKTFVEAGRPPYARRAGTTIFLHSLSQGIATGVELPDLVSATLQPGDDPQLLRKALSIALGEEKAGKGTAFWFLHFDGRLYLFKTEPSLEKVIQDEMSMVTRTRAKNELDERIRKVWRPGVFKPVFFPVEAGDLPDDAREPKLALIHYDAAHVAATDDEPPELLVKLFDRAGSMDGFRTYKNNVLFLAADEGFRDRMVELVQRHLSIQRIVGESGRLAQFSDEQRKRLKGMNEAAELDVRVAITRAYRYLFWPSADAPKGMLGLARDTLPAQDQGEVSKDQTGVVLRVLRQMDKVVTADDTAMAAKYVMAKAWPHSAQELRTEDLRKEFAKRTSLRMLLDPNQLRKTIQNGCRQGVWIYYDAEEEAGYGEPSPMPMIRFAEDTVLYTLDEAKRLGLRIKGADGPDLVPTCPVCGEEHCVCGPVLKPGALRFTVDGAPAQAFQQIIDRFHDEGVEQVARLKIMTEGAGKEAAEDSHRLGLALPQLGKAHYRVAHVLNAEFGEGTAREDFSLSFRGSDDRYKRVRQLSDVFAKEATKLNIRTELEASYPEGLSIESDAFSALEEVLTQLGMGRIDVEVEALETEEEEA